MKKFMSICMISIMFLVVLAGCGNKSQEDVVSDLQKKLEHMTGYKAKAEMTFKAGDKNQSYSLDIWFKKKSYYKIKLKGQNNENTQMIIRNKDGVFVLTPALNKSYRFQSKWPNNRSQYYLYQSLVKDILQDKQRTFEVKGDNYVFKTKTNYQTKELTNQKITLSKKNLAPVSVQVMDKDMTVLIDISFSNVTFDPTFEKNAFDVKTNMTGAKLEVPTMATKDRPFKVYYPTFELAGAELATVEETHTGGSKKVVLQYTGSKSYTLVEQKSVAAETSTPVTTMGDPVDLGIAIGAMSDSTVAWSYNGMDFYLASNDLTQKEMRAVAESVYGQKSK